jgi:NAD(P)-dependent dehydrogenase (short-subunit alcohol dehydrogenase family)
MRVDRSGKTAVVTGAASGVGLATSLQFVASGLTNLWCHVSVARRGGQPIPQGDHTWSARPAAIAGVRGYHRPAAAFSRNVRTARATSSSSNKPEPPPWEPRARQRGQGIGASDQDVMTTSQPLRRQNALSPLCSLGGRYGPNSSWVLAGSVRGGPPLRVCL